MKGLDPARFDVVCVSPLNHMLFTPLLTSAAVGTLDFRSIAEPIEEGVERVAHVRARATRVDARARVVSAEADDRPSHSLELPYDFFVCAVGARPATFGVPGVEQHALFLKELADARAVRTRILRCVAAATLPDASPAERAALLSFVIVGGGPTGVEFAGELDDFLKQDALRLHPELKAAVSVTIVEAGPGILSAFETSLRGYATSVLGNRAVKIMTSARVVRVGPRSVELADGTSLPCGLCVWNTGLRPQPLLDGLPANEFAKDRRGNLLVDARLRVLAGGAGAAAEGGAGGAGGAAPRVLPRVFALGDAATVSTSPFAPTAQVAEQQGTFLAGAFNEAAHAAAGGRALPEGRPAERAAAAIDAELERAGAPFVYRHGASLTALGMFAGAADFTGTSAASPLAPLAGGTLTGAAANVLWRGAYLTKLGSWRNRIQVPADWVKTFLLGRDTTVF